MMGKLHEGWANLNSGLGIERLACLIGNSMGGMTALAYLLRPLVQRWRARRQGLVKPVEKQ